VVILLKRVNNRGNQEPGVGESAVVLGVAPNLQHFLAALGWGDGATASCGFPDAACRLQVSLLFGSYLCLLNLMQVCFN